jgi:hypothetical protein
MVFLTTIYVYVQEDACYFCGFHEECGLSDADSGGIIDSIGFIYHGVLDIASSIGQGFNKELFITVCFF